MAPNIPLGFENSDSLTMDKNSERLVKRGAPKLYQKVLE